MEMDGLDIRALSNLLSSAKKDDDDKDYSDDEAVYIRRRLTLYLSEYIVKIYNRPSMM